MRSDSLERPSLLTRILGLADGPAEAGRQKRGVHAPVAHAFQFGWVVAACAATTLAAVSLRAFLDPVNLVMVYLLTVVLLTVRFGRAAGIMASFVAVLAFDVFLIPPYNSLSVADSEYVLTFVIMLVVSLIVSALTAGLRQQFLLAHTRERRTQALFELSQALSGAANRPEVSRIGLQHLQLLFPGEAFLLLSDQEGLLQPLGESPRPGTDLQAAAQRVFDCLPSGKVGSHGIHVGNVDYLPLQAPGGAQGMLVLALSAGGIAAEHERMLQTAAAQIAIAAERAQLVEEAQERRLAIESERLRNSLLSAISHDLRTPLTAIAGMAGSLTDSSRLPDSLRSDLLHAIQANALRMSAMVQNLLDMAKLQAGQVVLRREWQMIEEVVGSALAHLEPVLAPFYVDVNIPADFPLARFDAVLIERVLCNLLDNATKYAAGGRYIRISARTEPGKLLFAVEDKGPGLPAGLSSDVFKKFTRGHAESATTGAGLGLSICQAIIEAHQGQIWAENRAEGGARFVFSLPLESAPALEDVPDES